MGKRDEQTKKSIATATARFVRRAAGRIGKREARDLGRLYGEDIHWKYLRVSGDKLALREPGGFAELWGSFLGETFKRERRGPRRWAGETFNGRETARHFGFYFGWLGPSSGIWPGDSLAFDHDEELYGRARGWRVVCASDCPCGHCWRPQQVEAA